MTGRLWGDPLDDEAGSGLGGGPPGTQDQIDQLTAAVGAVVDNVDLLLARRRNRPSAGARGPRTKHRPVVAGRRNGPAAPWWNRAELDPDADESLERQVHAFGQWVIATYRIRHLPTHWQGDPGLNAEMLALYAGWRGAYSRTGATHSEPGQWHEALARFITRTEQYMGRRRQDEGAARADTIHRDDRESGKP